MVYNFRFACLCVCLQLVSGLRGMAQYSPDVESLAFKIVHRLNRKDFILAKGGHAMQMEKVVDALKVMNIGFPHE